MPAVSEEELKRPKCCRCRHHGLIVPKKGHSRCCPFQACLCWKCSLVTRRTGISARQRTARRARSQGEQPGAGPGTGLPPPALSGPGPALYSWIPAAAPTGPNPGGERGFGPEGRGVAPLGPNSCFQFGQTAPVPLIPFPFLDCERNPSSSSQSVSPPLLHNLPWLPSAPPAQMFNSAPYGPLMVPFSVPVNRGQPAVGDCGGQVFFSLPFPYTPHPPPGHLQGQMMTLQPPKPVGNHHLDTEEDTM